MSTANPNKLKIKDIITVVLLALINVVIFFASSVLYATPITIILMPVFFALLEGIVYFIIGTKVKKPGAILIYSIVRAIMGGYLPYKIFLILPTAALLSYVGVELLGRTERLKKRWIIVVLYVIIIQAGIGLRYEPEFLTGAPNAYKISASVIGLDNYIREIEEPFLLAPSEVAASIQEYDPGVRVAYGEGYGYVENNLTGLLAAAKEYGCNCLLVRSQTADMEYMQSQGYELVVILEGYHLYRL